MRIYVVSINFMVVRIVSENGLTTKLKLLNIILFDNIIDSEKYENYNDVKQNKLFMP